MKKTLPSFIIAAFTLIATALVVNVGKSHAAGPNCSVPSTNYTSIQSAVSDPTCTNITVAPGNYFENVTIDHSLTLKGAKAGANVANRTAGSSSESNVAGSTDTPVFSISAANVTVDGFSVTNPSHGTGVDIKTLGNNAVVRNNIVDNIGSQDYASNASGLYLELGPDNVKASNNKISRVQSVASAQAILVGDSTSANPSLGIMLDDNTISDVTSTKGAYGIHINNGASQDAAATGYTTGRIVGNSVKNLSGGWDHAIALEGDTPNMPVKYNSVSNLNGATQDKVAVWFEDNQFFFTSDVNHNSLTVGANGFGIAVQPALTTLYPTLSADGTCNWWGAGNGPSSVSNGSGSRVSTGVDFKPWLKSANLNGKCSDHGQSDFNDWSFGHKSDDKNRWNQDND
jgi:hypothetical protein